MAQFLKLSFPGSEHDAPGVQSSVTELARGSSALDNVPVERIQIRPEHRIVYHTDPSTPGADRVRYLRMHLRKMREASGLKTLLITSPIAGDGKSTLALNLATALTEDGERRVLLVEADLHHAPLADRLGLPRAQGLVDCLEKRTDPLSLVRRLDPLGWYLLPAGQVRQNPAELLQTDVYGALVKSLGSSFDWVLIDSPPVVAVSDAVFLRQHSDATLLVVRAGHTPQTAVDESVRQIGRQNIAAMVLNAVDGLESIYYKYGNKYYRPGTSVDPSAS